MTDWKLRYQQDLERPALELLDKPCDDCAVECGFYQPHSESLSKQPKHIVDAVSSRWFCHNDSSKSCRGNINYQAKETGF